MSRLKCDVINREKIIFHHENKCLLILQLYEYYTLHCKFIDRVCDKKYK